MIDTIENTAQAVPVQEKPPVEVVLKENEKTTNQIEAKVEEKNEDPNWRAFREARKKDRIEKEAAERKAAEKEQELIALKAAMEAAFAKDNRNGVEARAPVPESNGYYEETEDERIEKKVQAAIAARDASYERQKKEREHQEYPQRLQQTFPDFGNVVTSDHLDYLEYHYPEVAGPLSRLPESYDKWSDIYRAVKKFVPNLNHRRDAEKANENMAKPRSMSSPGVAQGLESSNNRATEEKRAENWARMQRVLKGLS